MASKSAPQTRLSAVYLDNDLVLSKSHAWTYVRIPLTPYEFMSDKAREYLCGQITLGLASLVTSSQETVDVHLRVVHQPLNVKHWAKNLNDRVLRQHPAPGWNGYINEMANHVSLMGFTEKEVFLGVCLGTRNTGSENGEFNPLAEILRPLKKLVGTAEKVAGYEDDVVPEKELLSWKKKARDVRRTLSNSHLKAVPATSNEIARLIANPLWPEMEQPQVTANEKEVWGQGEIRHITEGAITHHRKWLEVEQIARNGTVQTGFVASLAISRFPDTLFFPEQEPWMHFVSALPFPVDFSSRFTIVPPLQVQKDVGKKLADAKDSAQHIAESGTAVPLKVREQLEVATMLEYTIDKDRQPWAYARHRLLVYGSTEEELADRCRTVIETYQELGIDVAWPTGDQFDLLCESLPGDKARGRSYYQRQELSLISGGMATASSDCGDRIDNGKGWLGPYIGYTTSRVANAVMYAPNAAITRNNPPGVGIIGAPGGGKALALDTRIPTPSGWTTIEDIQPGDEVFAADGTPTHVLAVSEVFTDHQCYRVSFDDGTSIIADAGHRWTVETHEHRNAPARAQERVLSIAGNIPARTPETLEGSTVTLTTADMVDTVTVENGTLLNYSIPVAAPLQLPDTVLPIDPYTLGTWLAGRDSGGSADVPEGSQAAEVTTLVRDKRIPAEYLRASEEQRWALFAGLTGSNTLVAEGGNLEFCTTNEGFARDVYELVMTLGMKADRTEDPVGDHETLHRIAVTFVRHPQVASETNPTSEARRYITAIEPVDTVPTKCLTVAHSSHLFLAGESMVPTHNSFLAFTLAYQMALQGVWTIYIDPKADAKPMGELKELGNARVFDLRDGNNGMLDPFALGASRSESTLLAVETLRLLLGGAVSEEREEALLNAVERVSQEPQPSLSRVVDLLLANEQSSAARNLGTILRTIREMPFARLCFSPTGGSQLRPEDGLTVVTLLGLDLPTASTSPSDYSYENRLAVSVMYLLTRYSRKLMLNLDKSHPKAICIDEAWAITSTPQGAKLIPEVARMGRSHNCALVLVSQNASDLMAQSVTNSLSTKFAFRSSIPAEIDDVLTLFGLDKDQGYQSTILGLRNGECVMQDMDGRLARVQIDAWDQRLFDTFNTNPETRGKPGGQQ